MAPGMSLSAEDLAEIDRALDDSRHLILSHPAHADDVRRVVEALLEVKAAGAMSAGAWMVLADYAVTWKREGSAGRLH